MLNTLTFDTLIDNLIIYSFHHYVPLPTIFDLLSIIYSELNRRTNFYDNFYVLLI